jgi:hypothetical protein
VPQRVCDTCAAQHIPSNEPSEGRRPSIARPSGNNEILAKRSVKNEDIPIVPSGNGGYREFGLLKVRVIEARGLIAADASLIGMGELRSSDPYCKLRIGSSPQVRTETIDGTLEPKWDVSAHFMLCRREDPLHIEVFDSDLASADDPLGSCVVPIDFLRESSTAFVGWVPLVGPPEGKEHEKNHGYGGIKLELQLSNVRDYWKACMMPLDAVPGPPPKFDINAVYGPGMHLVDLLWTKFTSPLLFAFLDLIFWKQPKVSLTVLVSWVFLAQLALEHWPALFFLAMALYVVYLGVKRTDNFTNVKRACPDGTCSGCCGRDKTIGYDYCCQFCGPSRGRRHTRLCENATLYRAVSNSASSEEKVEEKEKEAELGRSVNHILLLLPAWVKELCVVFQPLLRLAADTFQLVHDLFVWQHSGSPFLVVAFLVLAVLCECFSIATQVSALGCLVLLACSPVVTFIQGFFTYVTWYRTSPTQKPEAWKATWSMVEDYDTDWDSEAFVKEGLRRKDKGGLQAVRGAARLLHRSRTLPTTPGAEATARTRLTSH